MRIQATRYETSNLSHQPPLQHEYGDSHLIIILVLRCSNPLENRSIEFRQKQLYCDCITAKYVSDKQHSKSLILLRSCIVRGKHQSRQNALHQLNDLVTLCIILGLKDNGYPKQSWQNPSIRCHAVNNVPVFGPSAVEELNGAASVSLIMNTDCQMHLRNFADCSLLQSQLKGRAVVVDSRIQCARHGTCLLK